MGERGVDGRDGAPRAVGPGSLVWYVAFGSNMVAERLACYLAGGRPAGANRRYSGARDASPPRATRAVHIPHKLVFAGVSEVWGGGVAFVEPYRSPDTAIPCVAHLITVEQLADLAAQECGAEAPGEEIAVLPAPARHLRVGSGRYDLLVGADPIDGLDAVILTGSSIPPRNEPSPAYAELVRSGRARAHGPIRNRE